MTAEIFSGVWVFTSEGSRMSTPAPVSWTHTIAIDGDRIRVREHMIRANAPEVNVTIDAALDGMDYPVTGSFAVETIAYSLRDAHTITGVGRKNSAVVLTEAVIVDSSGGAFTLRYCFYRDGKAVAEGSARFVKFIPQNIS
jgi:hypothetical protein